MKQNLIDFLSANSIPYRERGKNVTPVCINICCPFCHEDRYHCGINFERDCVFYCWVCSENGHWNKLYYKIKPIFNIKTPLQNQFVKFIIKKKVTKKKINVLYDNLELNKDQVKFLTTIPKQDEIGSLCRSRGISIDILNQLIIKPGRGSYRDYIFFLFGKNIIGRLFRQSTKPKWHREEHELLLCGEKEYSKMQPNYVVLTEGVFDMLRIPLGFGVAFLSVYNKSDFIRIISINKNLEKVIVALDRGVKRKILIDIKIICNQYNLKYSILNWNKQPKEYKDIDEIYVHKGENYLYDLLNINKNKSINPLI